MKHTAQFGYTSAMSDSRFERPVRVFHHIRLASAHWGGVETQFANFVRATRDDPRLQNYLTYDMRRAIAQTRALLPDLAAPSFDARRWRGMVVPRGLRVRREAAQVNRWNCDVILNTNIFGNIRSVQVGALAKRPAVYWERGASWFSRPTPLPPAFRSGYRMIIVNSKASGRMLQDVWNMPQDFEVLSPCIWTQDSSTPAAARTYPEGRPIRLGFAARLRAFKGGVLAVHTLKELERRGLRVELHVAGIGPDEERMRSLAAELGLADRVLFHGQVRDMAGFYRAIDLLVHPALREPYGNVCAEAIAQGIPVVATRVDGLPEVVERALGVCVTPGLPLSAFATLGGDTGDVYPLVYRPELDAVTEPGVPDPAAFAEAAASILASPEIYERYSRACVAHAPARYSPARHIDRFIALLRQAAEI